MIKALKSAAGPNMIRKGGTYSFAPEIEQEFVRAGLAEYIQTEKRQVEHGETSSMKHQKRGKK